MRQLRDKVIKYLLQLSIDKRVLKTAFYFYVTLTIFIAIMGLFSYQYIGSINPSDLLRSNSVNYTYAGTPDFANIYSTYLNIGIAGINNSQGDLVIGGGSNMTLYPTGEIKLISYDGNVGSKYGPIEVYTMPDEKATVRISVTKEDVYPRSMRLTFYDPAAPLVQEKDGNLLNIMKQNNNQYVILTRFAPGPNKSFEVNNDPRWNFPINISSNIRNIKINDSNKDDIKNIEFEGQISIATNGELNMSIPVSSTSGAGSYKVKLVHSDGILDVRHGEYKCNLADNITIVPANTSEDKDPKKFNGNSYVQLMNGHILAYGQAGTLEFREHNFNRPMEMLIKEGQLALFTGLLSSFLTLAMTRLISRFRKK